MLTRDIAETVLASVSERDRRLLELRFGLARTFDQIGTELGKRARQLVTQAIQRARLAWPLVRSA